MDLGGKMYKTIFMFLCGLLTSSCATVTGIIILDHSTSLYKTTICIPVLYLGTFMMLFPLVAFDSNSWKDVKNLPL